MTQIIHIRMQLCSSSIHPNFDDTNHPHWMLLYTINIHPKHDDKIIHMWMRLYSSNKHPKFDDTNHPHSDVIVHIKLAWCLARRESAWYTLMRFRLIKNGATHVYDVYTL